MKFKKDRRSSFKLNQIELRITENHLFLYLILCSCMQTQMWSTEASFKSALMSISIFPLIVMVVQSERNRRAVMFSVPAGCECSAAAGSGVSRWTEAGGDLQRPRPTPGRLSAAQLGAPWRPRSHRLLPGGAAEDTGKDAVSSFLFLPADPFPGLFQWWSRCCDTPTDHIPD